MVSVKGDAAYAEGKAWRPLAKGMAVREGTRVSTGVNSTAVLNIDDHILTVKPLTMIKVYRNSITRKASDNTIGLKYGTVNARIKRVAALKTRFHITTPVATSSVRGTQETDSQGRAFGFLVIAHEDDVGVGSDNGVNNIVRGRLVFTLRPNSPRPENLLADVKDRSRGRISPDNITGDEKEFLDIYGDQVFDNADGAVSFFDRVAGGNSKVTVDLIWPIID